MTDTTDTTDVMAPNVLALDGELTIARAAELRETLLAAQAQGVRALDLAAVEAFDTAGVQLLLAARHSARLDGTGFELRSVPAVVHEVLQRYGLADLVGPQART
jgi:anti-anti-sigma factor